MALALNYQVSEFRTKLKTVIKEINENGTGVSLLNRNDTLAVLLPNDFKELANPEVDFSKWMSLMFTSKFLAKAPSHIKDPQRKEFESIPSEKLTVLLNVKSLPVKGSLRSKVIKQIGKVSLERLEKRYKIAKAIIEAEEQNLYEAIEHQTGNLNNFDA